jgi:hypothetical protein
MKSLKNIFNKKQKQEPKPLRVEGVKPAPITAEPDEAELAAMALLEHMQEVSSSKFQVSNKSQAQPPETLNLKPETREASYYKQLTERIRTAHEAAHQRTQRFLAFCEQELKKHDLPKEGPGSLGLLRAELFKRLDVVERHGGELKTRWQHCLATVLVRLNDGMPPVSLDENEDVNK